MQIETLHALRAQRAQIHVRWEAQLRTERVTSPIANPDTLVYLIDSTIDGILAGLRDRRARRSPAPDAAAGECPCGRNPLLAYFHAGEQVMLEALVLAQAAAASGKPAARDRELGELQAGLRAVARREIGAFCAVCQYRSDFAPATGRGSGPEVPAVA